MCRHGNSLLHHCDSAAQNRNADARSAQGNNKQACMGTINAELAKSLTPHAEANSYGRSCTLKILLCCERWGKLHTPWQAIGFFLHWCGLRVAQLHFLTSLTLTMASFLALPRNTHDALMELLNVRAIGPLRAVAKGAATNFETSFIPHIHIALTRPTRQYCIFPFCSTLQYQGVGGSVRAKIVFAC